MIIFLIFWIIKKFCFIRWKNKNSLLRIITQIKIDSNNKIFVIDVQNTRLILGVNSYNISTLHSIPIVKKKLYPIVRYNKSQYFMFDGKNIIYKMFLSFLLCYSTDAHALEISEITKHIVLNNIYHWSFTSQFFLLTCLLALVSVTILMTTSFTRIIIVLSLLRNALGMPTLPPNQLLFGITICLTCFVMYPTYHQVYQNAYLPFYKNSISFDVAIINTLKPIYNFMLHQTRQDDLVIFSKLSHIPLYFHHNIIPIQILLPSFIMSELKTAFQIGFTIFLPFLIIDLFVATVLISLGMTMISPNTISLPIKLILFVMINGWQLVFSSLINSFY